jgi:hypothetical protein
MVVASRTLPAAPQPISPEAKPLSAVTPPAATKPSHLLHRPADLEIFAWNQARMAEWQAVQAQTKARAKAEMDTLAVWLRDLAPVVFGDDVVPLKIGIDRDIAARLARETGTAMIGRFLRWWTRRTGYLRALAAGNMRPDLDGNPTGQPTSNQRQLAAKLLTARRRGASPP